MINKILPIDRMRNLGKFIPTWKRSKKTNDVKYYSMHCLDLPFYIEIQLAKSDIESIKDNESAWIESNTRPHPITITFKEKKEIA